MMKMREKVIATAAACVLAVTAVLATAAPANAVYGNKIINSTNRCTTYIHEGFTSRWTICGLNNYDYDVKYVIVPPNKCIQMGYWSFTTYCAGYHERFVAVGGGWNYIR